MSLSGSPHYTYPPRRRPPMIQTSHGFTNCAESPTPASVRREPRSTVYVSVQSLSTSFPLYLGITSRLLPFGVHGGASPNDLGIQLHRFACSGVGHQSNVICLTLTLNLHKVASIHMTRTRPWSGLNRQTLRPCRACAPQYRDRTCSERRVHDAPCESNNARTPSLI